MRKGKEGIGSEKGERRAPGVRKRTEGTGMRDGKGALGRGCGKRAPSVRKGKGHLMCKRRKKGSRCEEGKVGHQM